MRDPIVPDHWTEEEALAVFEFVDAIREEVWSRYGIRLVERMRQERSTNPADWSSPENGVEFDDELDF